MRPILLGLGLGLDKSLNIPFEISFISVICHVAVRRHHDHLNVIIIWENCCFSLWTELHKLGHLGNSAAFKFKHFISHFEVWFFCPLENINAFLLFKCFLSPALTTFCAKPLIVSYYLLDQMQFLWLFCHGCWNLTLNFLHICPIVPLKVNPLAARCDHGCLDCHTCTLPDASSFLQNPSDITLSVQIIFISPDTVYVLYCLWTSLGTSQHFPSLSS